MFNRLKDVEPFKMFQCDPYFAFLDKFNMKVNDNQTKGIITGPFSSAISSELLLTAVDKRIMELITCGGEKIGYTRYVDDMTFFSDSKQNLEELLPKIQFILNDFRLRINSNKTTISSSVHYYDTTDLKQIYMQFPYLNDKDSNEERFTFDIDDFQRLKGHLAQMIEIDNKTEARTILTQLSKTLQNGKIGASDKMLVHLTSMLIQVACTDNRLASRAYRAVNAALALMDADYRADALKLIAGKNEYINKYCWDTIVQFWHYYVLRINDIDYSCKQYISELPKYGNTINPVLLCILSEQGYNSNKPIVKYIVETYRKDADATNENEWQRTIMWSKWWLPLFIIGLNDARDYCCFYSSKNYPALYRKVAEVLSVNSDGE